MGLFDKMFEKKYCDICGEPIGLLGNRKLEDGNCCKNCAAKLSPWFSERRSSTVEEIREQLAYRENNRQAVAAFGTTRTIGRHTKLLIDEGNRKFMVSGATDLAKANPDVLDFSQVTGCDLEIKENRSEMKRKDKDGKQVSYNPPRYEYSYNFYVTIHVNHPYFDSMHYLLSSGAVRTGEKQMAPYGGTGSWTVSRPIGIADRGVTEYEEYVRMGEEIRQALDQMRQTNAVGAAAWNDPQAQGQNMSQTFGQDMGQTAGQAFGQSQAPGQTLSQTADQTFGQDMSQTAGRPAPQPAAQMQPVSCPWCGSRIQPDGTGNCPLCGGPL